MSEVSLKVLRKSLQQAGIHPASSASFLCGVSGGLDSMVLVHLLARLGCSVRAIHVDHASHPDSADWADWVRVQLDDLGVNVEVHRLTTLPETGSLEEIWRNARRALFAQELGDGEVLVTAHHQDDQAETLLLQLLRGAGPAGLQAMPVCTELSESNQHVRPLLQHTRAELEQFATREQISWLEDPSNTDQRFARNYLRHAVLPRIDERWPGARSAIARSSELIAEAVALNEVLATLDCTISRDGYQLDWAAIESLGLVRQANAVRFWLQQCGVRPPSRKRLAEALRQWHEAAADRLPTLTLSEGVVQRYRSQLVFAPSPKPAAGWSGSLGFGESLVLPGEQGELEWQEMPAVADQAGGPAAAVVSRLEDKRVTVRYRRGGEKLRRAAGFHQSLKQWFQDQGIPPLLRDRLPMLFYGDQLIAIADIWIDARYRPDKDLPQEEKVCRLNWSRSTLRQTK